jgi:hypothetical protein
MKKRSLPETLFNVAIYSFIFVVALVTAATIMVLLVEMVK